MAPRAEAEAPSTLAWADNPEELGLARWMRDHDDAARLAKRERKPLLVLFDEVPGCSTVRAYGQGTLSDPLVVDAIEHLFVPLVVYNNVAGPDREVLERYGEPAWNNPVVRIVDPRGDDLVPRLTGDWSRGALLQRMIAGLAAADRHVPPWLALVAREDTAPADTAIYRMSCFWSGEAHLGSLDGVIGTRTGFLGGREVVEVRYTPEQVGRRALDAWAREGRSVPHDDGIFRPSPGDDRHRLRGTAWASVPMTPGQASRVNALVAAGRDPAPWLSPRQRTIHAAAEARGLRFDAGLGQIPLSAAFERAIAELSG